MVRKLQALVLTLLLLIPNIATAGIRRFFSPKGGYTDYLVKNIDDSKKTVYVMAYSFTSKPIIEALLRAHSRRVFIEVILDKSREKERGQVADILKKAGIRTFIDRTHAIQHSKFMIFDSKILATGSFNFSNAAEYHNAENSLGITPDTEDEKNTIIDYERNFIDHREHCIQH